MVACFAEAAPEQRLGFKRQPTRSDVLGMHRFLAVGFIGAMLVAGGCGADPGSEPTGPTRDSGPETDVAAVRGVMADYVRAAAAHDWRQVCRLLTAELAARQAVGGRTSCTDGLAYKAMDFVETGTAGAHPERANEDLLETRVTAVVVSGDFAQVALHYEGMRDPRLLSARRVAGAWRLASIPEVTIPISD